MTVFFISHYYFIFNVFFSTFLVDVCQKLAMAEEQRKWLIDCEAHKVGLIRKRLVGLWVVDSLQLLIQLVS